MASEIKALNVFNLAFTNSTIVSCFFLLLIIDLYLLIPAVNADIFNLTAELAIPGEIMTNEAKAEIETQSLTTEIKVRECSK